MKRKRGFGVFEFPTLVRHKTAARLKSDAFLISEFHLSGAKNKKILTSISELAGSPDSKLKESLDALP